MPKPAIEENVHQPTSSPTAPPAKPLGKFERIKQRLKAATAEPAPKPKPEPLPDLTPKDSEPAPAPTPVLAPKPKTELAPVKPPVKPVVREPVAHAPPAIPAMDISKMDLRCTECGTAIDDVRRTYCWNCGAKLFAEEHFYLVRRAFCDPTDPWYEFLIYTDCPIEGHWNPITTKVYMGKIPVDMPCSKVSCVSITDLIRSAQVTEVVPEPGNPGDNPAPQTVKPTKGLPLVMFVDSKENIERIRGRHPLAAASQEHTDNAERVFDGYLCVASAYLVRILSKKCVSLEHTSDRALAEGGIEGAQLIDQYRRLGKPKEPPKPKFLSPRVRRILKWVAVVLIGLGIAAAIILFGIPFIAHLLWGSLLLQNDTASGAPHQPGCWVTLRSTGDPAPLTPTSRGVQS